MILGKNFSNLKVILVEPSGPLNVGSVARLCSNFEVDELRIVSPKCDIFSLEAKKMALKGQKFLEHCKIFDDLQKAIFDCDLVLATCGRIDVKKDSFFGSYFFFPEVSEVQSQHFSFSNLSTKYQLNSELNLAFSFDDQNQNYLA